MHRKILAILTSITLCLVLGCSQEEQAPAPAQNQVVTKAQSPQTSPAPELPAIPPPSTDPKNVSILARWQPSFDHTGAQYTYLLSCIGHPDIEGVAVGFNIRDEVWKRSKGRLYVDYRPLAQLGGERDVLNKLRMGAVQGMLSSSVAAANLDDRLGLVNLPFLLDSPEKLELFRNDPELFNSFGAPLRAKGILVADFTSYGSYGWASRTPVKTIQEAKKINFRIAQAPVNTELYKIWGMKFTVMPWPDVPQALQTGVIDGLDHTPIVCSISRKFDNIKNFTFLNYAEGLYIHLINLNWLNKLPADLRQILLDVINEQSALSRQASNQQETQEIEEAKSRGVKFWHLDAGEREELERQSRPIYNIWVPKIGAAYVNRVKSKIDTSNPGNSGR